jgi:hypothetical protein
VINTLSEGDLDAPEINKKLSRFLDPIEDAFAEALRNEKAQGTLDKDLNIGEAT